MDLCGRCNTHPVDVDGVCVSCRLVLRVGVELQSTPLGLLEWARNQTRLLIQSLQEEKAKEAWRAGPPKKGGTGPKGEGSPTSPKAAEKEPAVAEKKEADPPELCSFLTGLSAF
mmetsp:Transcript_3996/g.4485  ORF Transcript_3996/g.4485 Transcript_3996/m.4485 type:complete len:114 (-) Transcript_3996:88-429(-)